MSRLQSVPYKWLVAAVFVTGLFMDLLDTTIVNVALPTLGTIFNAQPTTLEWIVTGYLLSLAVWIPASGWLGDRFGTKRIFLFALAMFTAGSALCGTATSIRMLILFRVLQGIGGGMLTPVGTTMLFRAFPPNERAKASAVLVIPIAVAPAIGPIIGGLLIDRLSWRWIFYVNVPFGIAALFFAAFVLKEHVEEKAGRFDVPGFLLSASGLPLLLYALAEAPSRGWTSAVVLLTGFAGVALLVLLVIVELRVAEPMLALRLFGDRMFRNATIVNFASSSAFFGLLFLLPLFLQRSDMHNLSATQSGLTTFPQALGLVIMSRVASGLYPKVGPRRMMMVGTLGATVATFLFVFVGVHTDLWWIRGIMLIRGMSFAFALIPLQAATFSNISRSDSGRASSLFNTNRQVASSLGVAVLATVRTDRALSHVNNAVANLGSSAGDATTRAGAVQSATLNAFHDGFATAASLSLIALVASFLIRDEDAAASMAVVTDKKSAVEAGSADPVPAGAH
ncbi:MAG: MDR family MFS transporter [Thermomicrobiales bacterium]